MRSALCSGEMRVQELPVAFQTAVLSLAMRPSPRAGALQEGHPVGDAHHVDAGGKAVRVLGQRGEHHEAAIAAPIDGDAVLRDVRLGVQPAHRVLQVRHAVHAQFDLVQQHVLAAIARAAAYVRNEQRIAAAEEVLEAHVEIGPLLAGGAAVHVEDARIAAGRRRRSRPIDKCRQGCDRRGSSNSTRLRRHKGVAVDAGAVAVRQPQQRPAARCSASRYRTAATASAGQRRDARHRRRTPCLAITPAGTPGTGVKYALLQVQQEETAIPASVEGDGRGSPVRRDGEQFYLADVGGVGRQ